MKRLTHVEFIEKLLISNEYYNCGDFVVLSKYTTANKPIILGTEYGICKMLANTLLRGANPVTINSAIDKHDYFLKELYKLNKAYRDGRFEVITKYVSDHVKIDTKNKYGICRTKVQNLRRGSNPNINSAIDRTKYWLKCAKEKNSNFDKYSFEKTIFIYSIEDIIIGCPVHGDFKIRPNNFTSKNQGCPKCVDYKEINRNNSYWTNTRWDKSAKESKTFDSFKVYIIRCWNKDEEFYKIGKTYRSVIERFKTNEEMPYEWEIIEDYICEDAEGATELESILKMENKISLYTPSIYFKGNTECFTTINTKCTYGKIWRKLQSFN